MRLKCHSLYLCRIPTSPDLSWALRQCHWRAMRSWSPLPCQWWSSNPATTVLSRILAGQQSEFLINTKLINLLELWHSTGTSLWEKNPKAPNKLPSFLTLSQKKFWSFFLMACWSTYMGFRCNPSFHPLHVSRQNGKKKESYVLWNMLSV